VQKPTCHLPIIKPTGIDYSRWTVEAPDLWVRSKTIVGKDPRGTAAAPSRGGQHIDPYRAPSFWRLIYQALTDPKNQRRKFAAAPPYINACPPAPPGSSAASSVAASGSTARAIRISFRGPRPTVPTASLWRWASAAGISGASFVRLNHANKTKSSSLNGADQFLVLAIIGDGVDPARQRRFWDGPAIFSVELPNGIGRPLQRKHVRRNSLVWLVLVT